MPKMKSSLKQYLITKHSSLTGEVHSFYIWLTDNQWKRIQPFLDPEATASEDIAKILPDHAPWEKEFILNGTTRAERSAHEHASVSSR